MCRVARALARDAVESLGYVERAARRAMVSKWKVSKKEGKARTDGRFKLVCKFHKGLEGMKQSGNNAQKNNVDKKSNA